MPYVIIDTLNITNHYNYALVGEGSSLIQATEGFCEGGFSVGVSLTNATANNNVSNYCVVLEIFVLYIVFNYWEKYLTNWSTW